jgi:hypothetical protein
MMTIRFAALLGLVLLSGAVLAIPLGYRYVGSLVVSEGRHVYWYWNVDYYEVDSSGSVFVARMHARNLERNEERPFVAIIRCDNRTYRRADSKDPYDPIEDGDPVFAVWRAGCDGTRAASLATRNERLNGISAAKSGASEPPVRAARTNTDKSAATSTPAATVPMRGPSPPSPPAAVPSVRENASASVPAAGSRADERRVDGCIRFAERNASQFGDAAITNTCQFAVEVAYCYKGGRGGAFDCPSPPRMKRVDSLTPGATHNLPEYKRGSNSGVALVACKGNMGTVTPLLNGDGGKIGCN